MKTKSLWTFVASIVIAFSLITNCAAQDAKKSKGVSLFLAYDSEEVIRDQSKVATITSTCGLVIDNVEVTPKTMRSANTSFFNKQNVNADVLPGEYTVTLTHSTSGSFLISPPTLKYKFEAGRVYVVSIVTIVVPVVRIKEVTSAKTIAKIVETRKNAEFQPVK
jgi:hypothetical protein